LSIEAHEGEKKTPRGRPRIEAAFNIEELQEAVARFCEDVLGSRGKVIGIATAEGGWEALVEVVEEEKPIDSILGLYEVTLDKGMQITSYRRKRLRRRSDTSKTEDDNE